MPCLSSKSRGPRLFELLGSLDLLGSLGSDGSDQTAATAARGSDQTLPSFGCSLDGNQIGDAGAAALSEALKSNATLTSLSE